MMVMMMMMMDDGYDDDENDDDDNVGVVAFLKLTKFLAIHANVLILLPFCSLYKLSVITTHFLMIFHT